MPAKSQPTPKPSPAPAPKPQPNTVPAASRPNLTPPAKAPVVSGTNLGNRPLGVSTPTTTTKPPAGATKAAAAEPEFTGPAKYSPGLQEAIDAAKAKSEAAAKAIQDAKDKAAAAKQKAADAKAKADAAKQKLDEAKTKTKVDVTDDGTKDDGTKDGSTLDDEISKIIQGLQDQINTLQQSLADQANSFAEQMKQAAEAAKLSKQEGVRTALEDFTLTLNAAGLGDLAADMDRMIKNDYTAAQIKIEIRGLQSYKNRFPGMESLSKKNRAISEGAYIDLERGYTQILRSYGLDDKIYGERTDLGDYIANEVSAREFEERVGLAKNKVDQQPDVTQALNDIYGIGKSEAVGFILNPLKAMDVIKKQVRASEIGAAAARARFSFGATQEARQKEAEALIGATGTTDLAELTTGFAKARTLADTQGRLSAIEREAYNEMEAVQAIVGGSQEAMLKSKRRAERETMLRFGGTSGVGGQSLRRTNIQ